MRKSHQPYHQAVQAAITAAAALICAAWAPQASAQAKCTMPNGVTITKNFGSCPLDAIEAFTLDGKPLPKPGDTDAARAIQEKTAAEKQQLKDRVTNAAIQEQQAVLEQWKKEAAEKKKIEAAEQEKRRQANADAIIRRGCATLGLASPQQCDTKIGIFASPAIVIKAHFLNFDPYEACKNVAWELRTKLLQGRSLPNWEVRIEYTPTGKTIAECPM